MILEDEPQLGDGFLVRRRILVIAPNQFHVDLFERRLSARDGRPDRAFGERSLLFYVQPCEFQRERLTQTARVIHRDLCRLRRRFTFHIRNADTVRSDLFKPDRVETRTYVWIEISRRADLVQKLCGHGADGYEPAVRVVLRDNGRTVGRDLRDREPGM